MRLCAIIGCSNSTYRLGVWKTETCATHHCRHDDEKCDCKPPFTLITFPTEKKDPEGRQEWAKRVSRKVTNTGKNWIPSSNDRICSIHFQDGRPTKENPHPTLHLGYNFIKSGSDRKRSLPNRNQPGSAKKKRLVYENKLDVISMDHSYAYVCDCGCLTCMQEQCEGCMEKGKRIKDIIDLHRHSTQCVALTDRKVKDTLKYIATDRKVLTYTGLYSRAAFENLLKHLSSKASKMRYWCGKKKTKPVTWIFKRKTLKFGPSRKLTLREELLMVLMKSRVNVINQMLGDIFGVSDTTVSQILNTWLKLLSEELKPLIFWPSKDAIFSHFPRSLRRYRHLRCTIDCTEVFIERPRNLELQALTWSDYKKHNTIKFLVGIAPNGAINFLSEAWGGRASDLRITRESGFLDLLEPNDLIMADRGFPIQGDLLWRGASLEIPPPSSGIEQMTTSKVQKTKDVANARIHVERAIGRIKLFSILSNTLPITLLPLIDDIIIVCAALSNLGPPLVDN